MVFSQVMRCLAWDRSLCSDLCCFRPDCSIFSFFAGWPYIPYGVVARKTASLEKTDRRWSHSQHVRHMSDMFRSRAGAGRRAGSRCVQVALCVWPVRPWSPSTRLRRLGGDTRRRHPSALARGHSYWPRRTWVGSAPSCSFWRDDACCESAPVGGEESFRFEIPEFRFPSCCSSPKEDGWKRAIGRLFAFRKFIEK